MFKKTFYKSTYIFLAVLLFSSQLAWAQSSQAPFWWDYYLRQRPKLEREKQERVQRAKDATVKILIDKNDGTNTEGSGFITDVKFFKDGSVDVLVGTAGHVLENFDEGAVVVRGKDGKIEYYDIDEVESLYYKDLDLDVGLVYLHVESFDGGNISRQNFPKPVELTTRVPNPRELVGFYGYGGIDVDKVGRPNETRGYFIPGLSPRLVASCLVRPGASGGPLVDANGYVIGVCVEVATKSDIKEHAKDFGKSIDEKSMKIIKRSGVTTAMPIEDFLLLREAYLETVITEKDLDDRVESPPSPLSRSRFFQEGIQDPKTGIITIPPTR